jgi:hypothetical protein
MAMMRSRTFIGNAVPDAIQPRRLDSKSPDSLGAMTPVWLWDGGG